MFPGILDLPVSFQTYDKSVRGLNLSHRSSQCLIISLGVLQYLIEDFILATCHGNQTYLARGADCAKCSNYMLLICGELPIPKCYCNPGYVREDNSKRCILSTDCPKEV